MEKSKSDNLSKGDIISFIALLLLGVTVFFGMNFSTLGDRIQSVVVSVVLVTLMVVFVFWQLLLKRRIATKQCGRK